MRDCRTLIHGLVSYGLLMFLMSAATQSQSVRLDISDENRVLRFSVMSYALVGSKLGERAPPGTRYLVVRGMLENKDQQQGLDVPPAADAFPLLLNGSDVVTLDPLTEDTADPFWGPQVILPRERRPVELVYVIPSSGVERAEIRHLSNQGRISLFIIGEAQPERTDFQFGPVELGMARIAAANVQRINEYLGYTPRRGHYLLSVEYWYTNLREMQPLETNVASLSALEVDGGYTYQSLTLPPPGAPLPAEFYHAGEPTPGLMVFEVPERAQQVVLVHYTEDGALRLPLSQAQSPLATRQAIAGPSREGRIEVSVFSQQLTERGLVLEVGLRLNHSDGMADLPIDLSTAFELHDANGGFVNSTPNFPNLYYPITQVILRRDQLNLGQLAFPGVQGGSYSLLLPLASGAVRLRLPPVGPRTANPAAERPIYRSPTAPAQRQTVPPPAPQQRQAPTASTGSSPTQAPQPSSTTPSKAPDQPKVAERNSDKITGIPQVVDTATLTIRWDIVQLYGIEGEGEPYRSQLEGYIRDREVSCERKGERYRCTLGDTDLSELAARNGAARGSADAPANIVQAIESAREKGAGIWQ